MKIPVPLILICLMPWFSGCDKPMDPPPDTKSWAILAPVGSHASAWSMDESIVPNLLDGAKSHLEHKLADPANELERDNLREILAKWEEYCCQIFPVIRSQNGAKVVTLSFFPSRYTTNMFKNWKKEPVMVDGGGSSFWTLTYDPEKKEYSDFGVNAME